MGNVNGELGGEGRGKKPIAVKTFM